jgi:hypothetical protein
MFHNNNNVEALCPEDGRRLFIETSGKVLQDLELLRTQQQALPVSITL